MPMSGAAVGYCTAGGLVLLSGVKGSTISDTVKAALKGNLGGLTNTEAVNFGSGATGSGASGSAILSDAQKYNGHKYVFGGPSNPNGGWDCSSFASYVLGHDLGLMLPGGKTWAQATGNGQSHGPVASEFASTPGFSKVGTSVSQAQAGDLLVWPTHVGFAVDGARMFSAFDTQSGTGETASAGPNGEAITGVFRIQASAGGSGSVASGSASAAQAYAKSQMAGHGWNTTSDFDDLVKLWDRESGWDSTIWNGGSHAATKPAGSSGAYGIPQSLPYTKMPKAAWPPGYGGSADAQAQIDWGLSYIAQVYHTPALAWGHEQQQGWY